MSSPEAAALHARAAVLLDAYPKQFEQAKALLRQALSVDPDHLEALHDLNWSLDRDRDLEPGCGWRGEQAALRERILALTRKVKPGKVLTVELKARSLALAHHAEALLQAPPSAARLKEAEATLKESRALRANRPEQHRAERGVMAWKALHRAHRGNPDAYQVLLDWVAEHPRPSPFHDDAHACAFRGLESAFADEGFHAWLRAKQPRPAKPPLLQQLTMGLEHVVDWDTPAFLGGPVPTPCRVGRLLALRALGGDLSVKVQKRSLLEQAKRLGDAALVKELEALAAPTSKKTGTKTQAPPKDRLTTALSFADLHVTAKGHIVVLAGTPHPTSDYGAVSGDDLWDFDEHIPWNQPWSDEVWLSQVTVDEDEVEPFEPTCEVDCNRLLIHDGKTWKRHRLPKALPYGYVAPTLRDLGKPWGLSGFGVSALAFAGKGRASSEWTVQQVTGPTALNLVDGVIHEGTLFALCGTNGLGRITSSARGLRFERIPTKQKRLHGLRSLPGTLFVLGDDGVWALDGATLESRCKTKEPVLDLEPHPSGGLVLRTATQVLRLSDGGKATPLKLPQGQVHSMAVFQGHVFVSVHDRILRVEAKRPTPLEVPTPAPGFARLKVAGGRLWAVFPHHLAFSTDGGSFEAVNFR